MVTDILHPMGILSAFGAKVILALMRDKPDFDFMEFAGFVTCGGEVEELLVFFHELGLPIE